MRVHALVLTIVVLLGLPTSPLLGAQSANAPDWQAGQRLVRRGDYAQAEQFYASLADQLGPNSVDDSARALLLEARAALADDDTDTAEGILQQLLSTYPSSGQTAGAYFTLAQARRAAGDCTGALRALAAFEANAPNAIGPYAALQRAQCLGKLGDATGELAAARAALSIDGGGPRLTRIEALERAAEAELAVGRKQNALDLYNQSLQLAGTRAYRAEMLFTTATLARALGQTDLALERFRAVVIDDADQARAPYALDALLDMGRGTVVSPYQAGLVRLNGKDYAPALALFDLVDADSPDWGAAQLARAEALGKLGRDDDMRQTLSSLADTDPSHAGSALLRLGQLQEQNGEESSAGATYARMAQVAPDRRAEALFHVGFTRYVGQDPNGARDAWQQGLASGPPGPVMQTQLLYWSAKTYPPESSQAHDLLQAAATAAPESYYGLRAQDALDRSLSMASFTASASPWLAATPRDLEERSAWLATLNTTPERVAADVAASPNVRRAEQLLELGLRTEASWETSGLMEQYVQARDVPHLSALADWLLEHDLPQLTLQVGKQERDLVGSVGGLPRIVQKQVFPAGWADLVQEQASAYRVDPLLMLAMIRQESSFDPRAQSGAQARGLTQVVPSTARNIAARLGRDDFSLGDLFKPSISLEFGSWFMAQLLGDYKGRIFPSLAAYNAGGGNVARWLNRYGDDPDVLVERIPLQETQTYLRIVYDNYWHYQALYGPGSAG